MYAVVINGQDLNVIERPDLEPGRNEVVIDVQSAGLNAADLLQRRGFYPAPAGWPVDIPGMECAGQVLRVGADVRDFTPGDRVCAVVGGGAQATQCAVPASHVLAVPDSVDLIDAGGFPEAFTTAYDALRATRAVKSGDRVLVSGAAGGVGTAAIQLVRAWGAHAIAATRDTRHHDALRELGAEEVVTTADVPSLAPVDFVLELVGAAHLKVALPIVAEHGVVVVIGVGAGGRVELDLLQMMVRRLHVTGSTLRSRSIEEKTKVARAITRDVVPLWSQGSLRVVVDRTFEIGDVDRAYGAFATGGKLGKILLRTKEPIPRAHNAK